MLNEIFLQLTISHFLSTCQNTLMFETNYLEQVSVCDIQTSCN
jgi:hypothetical protein